MTRTTTQERRATPRVDARLPLQLTETDTRQVVTTESVDVSRNGIACRTADYLAPLSKVALTIILPPFGTLSRTPRSLRAEGVVVRCDPVALPDEEEGREPEYELACCFTALESDARTILDAFVAWRLLRSVRVAEDRATHGRPAPRPAAVSQGRPGRRPRPGTRAASGAPVGAHSRTSGHARTDRHAGAARPAHRAPREGARPATGDSPEGSSRRGHAGPRPRHPAQGPHRERRGPSPRTAASHPAHAQEPGAAAPGPTYRAPSGPPAAPAGAAESPPRRWGRRPARKPRPHEPGDHPAGPRGRKD